MIGNQLYLLLTLVTVEKRLLYLCTMTLSMTLTPTVILCRINMTRLMNIVMVVLA